MGTAEIPRIIHVIPPPRGVGSGVIVLIILF